MRYLVDITLNFLHYRLHKTTLRVPLPPKFATQPPSSPNCETYADPEKELGTPRYAGGKLLHGHLALQNLQIYGLGDNPRKVDRTWLLVYCNKIPINPYSIYVRGTIWVGMMGVLFKECTDVKLRNSHVWKSAARKASYKTRSNSH